MTPEATQTETPRTCENCKYCEVGRVGNVMMPDTCVPHRVETNMCHIIWRHVELTYSCPAHTPKEGTTND